MRLSFTLSRWAAWAPGLTSREAWEAWALGPPIVPLGTETPALTEVPPMVRRRIEKQGRLAFQVASWCQGETKGMPLVFASRHGDVARSVELLETLVRGDLVSPTSFALSVHNAMGAQYSIVRQDRTNVTAIANGVFTVEAAVIEAVGLLQEAPEVTVVVYDAPVPASLKWEPDEAPADFAYAWTVTRGSQFVLETAPEFPKSAPVLPHSLEVLRFVLGQERALEHVDSGIGWRWSRG